MLPPVALDDESAPDPEPPPALPEPGRVRGGFTGFVGSAGGTGSVIPAPAGGADAAAATEPAGAASATPVRAETRVAGGAVTAFGTPDLTVAAATTASPTRAGRRGAGDWSRR